LSSSSSSSCDSSSSSSSWKASLGLPALGPGFSSYCAEGGGGGREVCVRGRRAARASVVGLPGAPRRRRRPAACSQRPASVTRTAARRRRRAGAWGTGATKAVGCSEWKSFGQNEPHTGRGALPRGSATAWSFNRSGCAQADGRGARRWRSCGTLRNCGVWAVVPIRPTPLPHGQCFLAGACTACLQNRVCAQKYAPL
jgi:hypothetical protein